MPDTAGARINRFDPHGARRSDAWRASAAALGLVTEYRVDETDDSDHHRVTIGIT